MSEKKREIKLVRGEYFPLLASKVLMHYDEEYCDPETIKDGDIVYCDTHDILSYKNVLNKRKNLIIITHNSDHFLCDGPSNNKKGISVDELTCYSLWFGQNSYSKQVISLPIGFENRRWEQYFGPKTEILNKVQNSEINPLKSVYLNCKKTTSLQERTDCYNKASKMNFVTVDHHKLSYQEYLTKIKNHKFVMSPRGNGLDCHRTWETLAMKRVPILKREGSYERLYKNIPVLFVDQWEDLYKINFEEEYSKFSFKEQDYLKFKFWEDLILNKIRS